MAEQDSNGIHFSCEWQKSTNLGPTVRGSMGYLLKWSGCGGLNLPTDIKVWHPWPDSLGKTGEHFKCVGLMENFEYGGGETDPIRISAWVSANTKGSIASAITKGIKQTKFNFSFFIVDFDTEKKVWFDKAFVIYPFTGVQAALNTTNGAIQLFAGSEPQSIQDHLDIKLYRMEFEAVPQENKVGRLHVAYSKTANVIKKWGEIG